MARFRFCLVASPQRPIVEVPVSDIGELHAAIDRCRYVEGRLVECDGEGADCDVLIPVGRIQMILAADD